MTDTSTTICVIDYNYGHYLAGAVDSALAQDVPVDVVVVDDGSTDDSGVVSATYGDRIRYLWKPNGGLSDARNFGLERCNTPYLLFLDADDRLPPDFIRVTRSALEADPDAAFAYTQLTFFEKDDDQETPAATGTNFAPFSAERLKRGNYINAAALLRLSSVGTTRYDTRLRYGLEDWEFFIALAERGQYGIRVDQTSVRYRTHASSMGQDLQRRNWRRRATYVYVIAKHWRFFGMSGAAGFLRRSARSRFPGHHAPESEG